MCRLNHARLFILVVYTQTVIFHIHHTDCYLPRSKNPDGNHPIPIQTEKEKPMTCPICTADNEDILLQTPNLRVIAVHNEAGAPAFCRVIWNDHVSEMTDLSPAERNEIMEMVYQVEAAMRQVFRPAKINLASLGNVVPHLHWHVIARFENDANFPAPIWAAPVREHGMTLPENWPQQIKNLIA